MTNEQKYTAQEMREVAEGLVDSCVADIISILVGHRNLKVVKGDRIVAMLRYAADVVERANERRGTFAANYGRIDYEQDSAIVDEIDYILRGDAGKEEK